MRHHLVVFHLLVASTCVRAFEDVLCVLEPPITIATETFVCEKPNSKSALDQILNQNVLQDITAASARENAVMQSLPVVTGHTPPFGHSISVAGEGILRNELVHRGIHLQKLMTKWEDTQEYTESFDFFSTNAVFPLNISDTCFIAAPVCDPVYKYRTLDGSCNNLNRPTWGMTNTAFSRLLPPRYADEADLPRTASDGGPLPLARKLSTTFFPDVDAPDLDATLVTMQWGQLVAHDVSSSPRKDDAMIDCCSNLTTTEEYTSTCLPIIYPKDDPFFSKFNRTCENMIRTHTTLTGNCQIGPAQQVNGVTHLIDGSFIYGSNSSTSRSLRELVGGRLAVRTDGTGRIFMPNVQNASGSCFTTNERDVCYRAGDGRVNQNAQLAVLQNVFVREHNRVANELQKLHPPWDDETLYQETRRIVIAEFQHITYKEWLPKFVGERFMLLNKLYPKTEGYSKYDERINPMTINSFSAAAYRVGHSGIQGELKMYNYQHEPSSSIWLSDWMNRPSIVEDNGNFDQLLLGLVNQPLQKPENFFTTQVTQLAFHFIGPFGIDLESFDIQRGRDHGLPVYIDMVKLCSQTGIEDFDDLLKYIKKEHVDTLKANYKTVEDIDLFVGGMLENKLPSAKFGPTFACIVGEQFYRYKYGDRFWYEVEGQPHSFSPTQLDEIRKATLARLICDNGDAVRTIYPNSFNLQSEKNRAVSCTEIPRLDLMQWR